MGFFAALPSSDVGTAHQETQGLLALHVPTATDRCVACAMGGLYILSKSDEHFGWNGSP